MYTYTSLYSYANPTIVPSNLHHNGNSRHHSVVMHVRDMCELIIDKSFNVYFW